jgi:hypothetical protein
MKFCWTDYGFSAAVEPYDFHKRTSIDVQLCMYRLWQYLVLILLMCVSANPFYQSLEKIIGESLHIFHRLLLEHIYIWHSIIAFFSSVTGMELPATYVPLLA